MSAIHRGRENRPGSRPTPTHEWRLLVPGKLGPYATNILERDVQNDDFEAGWRAHLETLSDGELLAMTPEKAFVGLFDKVERVRRALREERARRGYS